MDSKKVLGISIAAFFGGVITSHIINIILSGQKKDNRPPTKPKKPNHLKPKPTQIKPGLECKMVLLHSVSL